MARRTATAAVNLLVFTVLSMAFLLGAAVMAALVQDDAQTVQQKIRELREGQTHAAGLSPAPQRRPQ
jgi:hypothetical protein